MVAVAGALFYALFISGDRAEASPIK